MEKLTSKEEEIMQILWDIEQGFVKDVIKQFPDPKPPYTTVSSIIRILEDKGFVSHNVYGNTHQYFPIVGKEEYRKRSFSNLVDKYFDNSAKNVVSFLLKEEKLSAKEIKEIKELLNQKSSD